MGTQILKIEISGTEYDFLRVEDRIVFNTETLELLELWKSVENDFITFNCKGCISVIMNKGTLCHMILPLCAVPDPYEVISIEKLKSYNEIYNKLNL